MPDRDRVERRQLRWTLFRQWAFRVLLGMCVLWGMFSAAVVFAVRYDLLPGDGAKPDEALRPLPLDEARDWPVISASDWRRVIPPDSALVMAHADSTIIGPAAGDASSDDGRIEWLNLRWAPIEGTAAWIAFIATPACNCPFEAADRWDLARIVMDPLTGSSIERALLPEITAKEMAAQFGVVH